MSLKVIKPTKEAKKELYGLAKMLRLKLGESYVSCVSRPAFSSPRHSVVIECGTIESAHHIHRLLTDMMNAHHGEVRIYR